MSTDNTPLFAQQRHGLEALRADAPDIANLLADEVWDRFEAEFEEATEDGILFELAGSIGMSLSLGLMTAFDNAFDRHVLKRCAQLNAGFSKAQGEDALDTTGIDLSGIRKSMKLRRHAQTLIDEAIERAKPGVGRAFGAVIGGIFGDPMKEVDAIDRNMQEDAQRLRQELLSIRNPLRQRIAEESLALIQFARLEMTRQIEQRTGSARGIL